MLGVPVEMVVTVQIRQGAAGGRGEGGRGVTAAWGVRPGAPFFVVQ